MRVATNDRSRILVLTLAGLATLGAPLVHAGCMESSRAGAGANTGAGTGAAPGGGGDIGCATCPSDTTPTSEAFAPPAPTPTTSASSTSSAGTTVMCPTEPQGSNVARAPENTRTFDSAVYAHTLLAHGIRPDPAAIKLTDFVNLDAYSTAYDATDPAKNVSLDVTYDPPTGRGVIVGRIATPPVAAPAPVGMVIVLDTSASITPVRDVELAAAQALLSKLSGAAGDDAIVRTWDAAHLGGLGDSATQIVTDARAGIASLPVDKLNDVTQMLESAAWDAGKLAPAAGATKHVVVFTDGGLSTNGLEPLLLGYNKRSLVLDVISVASEASLEKGAYDAFGIEALTAEGGARLLVTDEPGAAPTNGRAYRDVDDLVLTRFDDVFRDAYLANRVVLTLPKDVIPIGMPVQPNGGMQSTTASADAAVLRGVAAGFGRGIELRQLFSGPPGGFMAIGCLVSQEIHAKFHFQVAGVPQEVLVKKSLIGPVGSSPSERYDTARTAYVAALRQPTLAAFQSSAAAATPLLEEVHAAFCGSSGGLDSTTCGHLARMSADLKLQPHP